MTALLALITVVAWGTWIPLAQTVPGATQRIRTFYATAGNLIFATVSLLIGSAFGGGVNLTFGWRDFWLPLAGGIVWTMGNYTAFRAADHIGLARAAGSWTPLNIIVAFVWGAALFGELDGFSAARFAVLGGALVLVIAGVLVIIRAQEPSGPSPASAPGNPTRAGLLWATAAGILWGSYFVPAQWAGVSARVADFPLAIGIMIGGLALTLPAREPLRLPPARAGVLLACGAIFGVGNLALLGLVARVGTGVGFTIAQLCLVANAGAGIWLFKVPKPGSPAARLAIAGILLAGTGGAVIGALR
ncbi:MAG TPA: GRP family sugar transporter [Streptosporangiaceae bacterium]